MPDRDTSPAYRALLPSARKILALIDREVTRGGGVAQIRLADFADFGVPSGIGGLALRQVALLGFVTVERGPPSNRINTFRLSDDWQRIDTVEAARLRTEAKKPKPKPKPVGKPRTMKRPTPSLPAVSWDRVT